MSPSSGSPWNRKGGSERRPEDQTAQGRRVDLFIGDALEEGPDEVIPEARELGRLGVPAFMFQEGDDRRVEQVFREIASVTKGAYCRFDPGAARQLAELLKALAVFAVGGIAALATRKDAGAVKLLAQIRS
jgi:hypothetical protein